MRTPLVRDYNTPNGLARAVNETYRTVPVALLLVPAERVVGPAAAQAYFLEFPALPAAVVAFVVQERWVCECCGES